jgi:hypothetical protein
MRKRKKYCTAGLATDDYGGMRIACSIHKIANTQSEYVIIIAFPLQQWLHERAQCYVILVGTKPALLKLRQPLDRTKSTNTFQIRICSCVCECRRV